MSSPLRRSIPTSFRIVQSNPADMISNTLLGKFSHLKKALPIFGLDLRETLTFSDGKDFNGTERSILFQSWI